MSVGLVVAFFAVAGAAVAATATALATLARAAPYSPITFASFLIASGVPLVLGVLFAVAGRGPSRLLLAGAWFALAYGAVQAWSSSPWLTSVLTPVGLTGLFWVLASFPGIRPQPRWLRWPVAWLAVWSCVCFGIPPVRDAINSGTDPWNSLVGPGFLIGLTAILVGKAVDFPRAPTATRRWYVVLGVVLALMLVGGATFAALTSAGHVAVGNDVDESATLFGNTLTAILVALVGAAAIKEGLYGVVLTDEQRRAAWHAMFPDDSTPEAVPFDLDGLTYRERQLLPLLATGTPTEAMARRLGVSEKTVRNYLTTLYAKLGATDRATGALAARKATDG